MIGLSTRPRNRPSGPARAEAVGPRAIPAARRPLLVLALSALVGWAAGQDEAGSEVSAPAFHSTIPVRADLGELRRLQAEPMPPDLEPLVPRAPGAGPTPGRDVAGLDDPNRLRDRHGPELSSGTIFTSLPRNRLWEPPLANQREPRFHATFSNARNESTIDTAIGSTLPLARWTSDPATRSAFQIDAFAGVFSRFNERRMLTATDYRVGLPLTWSRDRWRTKLSYEHTSTHLGDEFIAVTGRQQVSHVRDEIVVGLARHLGERERWRVYAQGGYSFVTSRILTHDRDRWNFGVEWADRYGTSWKGRPFAALDFDLRSEQDYTLNTTFQAGWRFADPETFRGARIALELYRGKSPYGQFFRDREDWVGLVLIGDL